MGTLLQNPFWELVIGAIVGGIVGLAMGRLFDKPLERWQRKITYSWQRLVSRFRNTNTDLPSRSYYEIGKWRVPWVVVAGSSSAPYSSNNVICQYEPAPLVLPPDRERKKRQIEATQSELEKTRGAREFHNGSTVALAGFVRGQIGAMEEPQLVLQVRRSDYYTFLATAMSLDDPVQTEQGETTTVRHKYMRNLDYASPLPEFASTFAIQLCVITRDGYIMVSKRSSKGIVGYSNCLAPALNECVNPDVDRTNGSISLFNTARRAAEDELGIEITEDELTFFTLGVDIRYYMYTLLGLVRSKSFSRDDIIHRYTIGHKERWEGRHFYLPHNLQKVTKWMSEKSRTEEWSPYGVVCLTQTLMREFGTKATERALSKYPLFKPGK